MFCRLKFSNCWMKVKELDLTSEVGAENTPCAIRMRLVKERTFEKTIWCDAVSWERGVLFRWNKMNRLLVEFYTLREESKHPILCNTSAHTWNPAKFSPSYGLLGYCRMGLTMTENKKAGKTELSTQLISYSSSAIRSLRREDNSVML